VRDVSDPPAGAGAAPRAAPGRRAWPVPYGLLAAYAGAAVVTAGLVLAAGTRHPAAALVAYGLLAAIVAAHTRPAAAVGVALIVWLFDDGFIIGRHAHLSWHGAADARWLIILLAAGAMGSMLGARIRAARPGPAPGDGTSVASGHTFRP
jgi:hypothetical protein